VPDAEVMFSGDLIDITSACYAATRIARMPTTLNEFAPSPKASRRERRCPQGWPSGATPSRCARFRHFAYGAAETAVAKAAISRNDGGDPRGDGPKFSSLRSRACLPFTSLARVR